MSTLQRAQEEAVTDLIKGLIAQGVSSEIILKAAKISKKKLEKMIDAIQSNK